MWVKTIACNHAYKPKSTVIACFLCPLPLVMLAWLHYSDIWAGCHYSSLGILIWLTIPDSEGPGSAFFPLLYTTLFFYSVQSHLACHVIHCDNPKDSIDKSLPRLVGEKKDKNTIPGGECIPTWIIYTPDDTLVMCSLIQKYCGLLLTV